MRRQDKRRAGRVETGIAMDRPVNQTPTRRQATDEAIALYGQILHGLRPWDAGAPLQHDVTLRQLRAIDAIHPGPNTIGQVAAVLGIAQPTASLLVERLARLGLVERTGDPGDRRKTLVRPTPTGEAILTTWRGDVHERLAVRLAQLSDDDLRSLTRGLRALAATSAVASHASNGTDRG
jgi:DNA-binding MarR family transcriptional regulator